LGCVHSQLRPFTAGAGPAAPRLTTAAAPGFVGR
jgi:hypothetical protein